MYPLEGLYVALALVASQLHTCTLCILCTFDIAVHLDMWLYLDVEQDCGVDLVVHSTILSQTRFKLCNTIYIVHWKVTGVDAIPESGFKSRHGIVVNSGGCGLPSIILYYPQLLPNKLVGGKPSSSGLCLSCPSTQETE